MTSPKRDLSGTRVAVVGGGLAGLAVAAALADQSVAVELFEGRRQLGGRAASFFDTDTGEWIDHCQHVSMGCCTNLVDFFRRAGATDLFRRDDVLHWIAPDGRQIDLRDNRLLPSPLHLAPGLWRLKFLTAGERIGIARALLAMARTTPDDVASHCTIADWLGDRKQSPAAVAGFWQPVLISALADTIERVSYSAARKVFVDGFMANRKSYVVEVPRVSLTELYDRHIGNWLAAEGVKIQRQTQVCSLRIENKNAAAIVMADGSEQHFDHYIVAVPWHKVSALVESDTAPLADIARRAGALESSPITAVHLWFDRAINDLPHAVLPGRTSQWIFHRPSADDSHYYQVVISGSRSLAAEDRQQIVRTVCDELADVWPMARDAELIKSRVVTDRNAVFSPRPGHETHRPPSPTDISNVYLAGDWVATGWPATMEGAVRSGYLAAESLLASLGRPTVLVVPERPRQWLARLLIRS